MLDAQCLAAGVSFRMMNAQCLAEGVSLAGVAGAGVDQLGQSLFWSTFQFFTNPRLHVQKRNHQSFFFQKAAYMCKMKHVKM